MVRNVDVQGKSIGEVLRRRGTIAISFFLAAVALSCVIVANHKYKYAAISHVMLVNDPSGRDPALASLDMPTIATGSTILLSVKSQLNLPDSVNDLRKAVNAKVAPRSSLMTIAVQNHDPALAIQTNNAIADTFAKLYWNLAGSRYDAVLPRLTAGEVSARRRLRRLDRSLESASSGAAYVGSQASLDASAAHLGLLQENRGIAFAQLATDHANYAADLALPGKTAKVVRYEILKNNGAYNQSDIAVSKDVAQYTTTRAGVTDVFPGIAGFEDKVVKERGALDVLRKAALSGRDAYSPSQAGQIVQTERDAAAVKGDLVRVAAYNTQIRALERRLSKPPANVPSMGALRAERDTAEAQLEAVSLALTTAETSSAQARSLGEVVVVDRATDARPTLISPPLLLALGVVASLLVAIAASYLAEALLPRLIGSSDVERVYGRPILASLRAR